MEMVAEFLERAFELKGAGWPILIIMTGTTISMVFSWIEHWPFRMVAAPSLFSGAVFTQALMDDHGLHITTDPTTNQAVGFGIGIIFVTVVISVATWAYYESTN